MGKLGWASKLLAAVGFPHAVSTDLVLSFEYSFWIVRAFALVPKLH